VCLLSENEPLGCRPLLDMENTSRALTVTIAALKNPRGVIRMRPQELMAHPKVQA
jgi:hypothetical protein